MENLREENKLIAEFMKIPTIKTWGRGVLYNIEAASLPLITHISIGDPKKGIRTKLLVYEDSQLLFHSSWDWLMSACKKWDNIDNIYCEYTDYVKLCNDLDNLVSLYEIQPVFDHLVECIKWYNKTLKLLTPLTDRDE